MKVKRLFAFMLALMMLFTLAACGNEPGTAGKDKADASETPKTDEKKENETKDNEKADAPARNSVNIQVYGDSGTLDPLYTAIGMQPVTESFYESLWNPGFMTQDGEQIPTERYYMLAESVENISETEFYVHLRDGVTFTNGNPFNADDVLFSMEHYRDGVGSQHVDNIDFEKTEIIDELTVKVALKNYNIESIARLGNVRMLDKESYKEGALVLEPNGTGPYKLKEYIAGSHTVVEARDDYWGGKLPMKTIMFRNIDEASQCTNAYETGEVDFLTSVPTTDIEYLESMNNAKLIKLAMPTLTILRFNMTENSIMYNKDARYAVIYSLDLDAINNIVYGNTNLVPKSINTSGAADYDPNWETTTSFYTGVPDYEKAQEYADKAGLTGQTVRIVTNGVSQYTALAEIIQACLSKIGVTVTITNFDAASFKEKCNDFTLWDLFAMEHSNSSNLGMAMSTRILISNKTGWSDADYEYMLAKAKGVVQCNDEEQRKELFYDYLVELQEYSPAFNVSDASWFYVMDTDLHADIFNLHSFRYTELYWE